MDENTTQTPENNDIRMAVGSLVHAVRDIRSTLGAILDKLDDQGATLTRLAPLGEFLLDVKNVVEQDIPKYIDSLADDPMLGALIGPYASQFGSVLDGGLSRRRSDRVTPPVIEGR